MESEIICPVCNTGKELQYTHLVRTWVIGKKTFECNGYTVIENTYPDFFPKCTIRGSSVIILYNSEFCDHMWIDETYFHKGCAYHQITSLTTEQIEKFSKNEISEMWRD